MSPKIVSQLGSTHTMIPIAPEFAVANVLKKKEKQSSSDVTIGYEVLAVSLRSFF